MFKIGKKTFIVALTLACLPSYSIMSNTTVVKAAAMQQNSHKIQAVNSSALMVHSSMSKATLSYKSYYDLDAPYGLTAKTKNDSKISLDWDSVSDATSYYVYRATSYSGTYSKIATVSTSSYTDCNLSYNKTYYYKVKAHNSSDTSNYSSIVHATTDNDYDSDLDIPKALTAKAKGDTNISLDWDSVSGSTSYYVYRATSYSGTYSKIATVSTSSYTDYNLSYNKTYYYKVKAHNSGDTSNYSSIVYTTTDRDYDSDLDVPKSLTAEAKSDTKISLDWNSVSGATSYYVYRATSYSGTFSKIATVSTSNYTDYNLSYNKVYYYKIKAHNNSDTSNYSSIVHATTDKDYDNDLDVPEDLTAKAKSDSKISLDWDSVSGATSYYVYRATSYSGTFSKIATVSTSCYTDYNLSHNKTYYYKIKAHNSSDTSNYSSAVHATTDE